MKRPIVSIIIPSYNYARFLAEAIQSALDQTYPKIEILVVDDGSTDGTEKVVQSFGEKVLYFHKPNSGLSDTRNYGVDKSMGEFLVFLDADDKLEPTFVAETIAVLLQNTEISFVYTQVKTFGRDSSISTHPDYNLPELKKHNYINASAIFRFGVFKDVRYTTSMKSGWEDWDFYISLAEHGYYGKLLNKPLLLYRKHADLSSMSDQMTSQRLQLQLLLGMAWRHTKFFGLTYILCLLAVYLKQNLIDLVRLEKPGNPK